MLKNKIFFLVFVASYAHASPQFYDWTEKGNGGDAVICLDTSKNQMYDAFEAEIRHGLSPQFPPSLAEDTSAMPGYSGFQDLDEALRIAGIIIDRAQQTDLSLHKKLKTALLLFRNRVRFVAHTNLIDVEDMGMAFLPNDCVIRQLVIQRRPIFPSDRLYTIALDYWKTLNIQNKAVAISHEVLYTVALSSRKMESSEAVRYFNALLLADKLKDLEKEDYRNLYDMTFGTQFN